MDSNEIWKPVEGYGGRYMVSNMGRIKSFREYKKRTADGVIINKVAFILKPYKSKYCPSYMRRNPRKHYGYERVTLCRHDKDGLQMKKYLVHNLVARAFIGERPSPKHQIDHINRNMYDNRAENLHYVTPSENVRNSPKRKADSFHNARPVIITMGKNTIRFDSMRRAYEFLTERANITYRKLKVICKHGGGFVQLNDKKRALIEPCIL